MRWHFTSIALFGSGILCGLVLSALPADSVVRAGSPGTNDEPGSLRCAADIAPPGGDNVVNVLDLLAVINSWGACVDNDQDDDGWTVAEGDCDDNNPDVHPGAPELCNGIDDDCDDQIDEGFADGAANTCANATYLGQLEGDLCGGGVLNDVDSLAPAGDIDFFRARITENSSSNQDLYARVTLTAPPGAASPLRLCVTCNSCGSPATICVDVNPGQSAQLIIAADDEQFGGDDSFDLYVQVSSVSPSMSICQDYQLTVSCVPGTAQLWCN